MLFHSTAFVLWAKKKNPKNRGNSAHSSWIKGLMLLQAADTRVRICTRERRSDISTMRIISRSHYTLTAWTMATVVEWQARRRSRQWLFQQSTGTITSCPWGSTNRWFWWETACWNPNRSIDRFGLERSNEHDRSQVWGYHRGTTILYFDVTKKTLKPQDESESFDAVWTTFLEIRNVED